MLCKEFNKIGDTSYRVKRQVTGYIQLAQFLLKEFDKINQPIIKIDKTKLDKNFKDYVIEEQIYSYKNDKTIKNRINFVMNLFKKIKLVKSDKTYYEIEKNRLESLLSDPTKNLFNLFIKNFDFFKVGMDFIFEENDIDSFYFATTLLIFEKEKDDFSDLYHKIKNNYELVLTNMVFQLFAKNNPEEITPQDFLSPIKKPTSNHHFIMKILEKMRNNIKIDEMDINNMCNIDLISKFIHIKVNGFYRNKKKNKPIRNKSKFLQDYFKNATYSNFIMDINIARLWALVGIEYNDLMIRWLNDFKLISNNKITNSFIYLKDKEFDFKDIKNEMFEYPYNEEIIKKYLVDINNHNYSFKLNNDDLRDVPNYVLAEYFVNLYFAYKNNIIPKDFAKFSRTKLQYGSLLPISQAPGKGPDMFFIKDNKLTTIETTVHKNKNSVIDHELFRIIRHVEFDKISFLTREEISNLKSTEIILVTPLKNEDDINYIKTILDNNYQKEIYNCGQPRNSYITNFEKLLDL